MAALEKGARVRFTVDNLGAQVMPGSYKFDDHVGREDEGIYDGPHASLPGWHWVTVERDQHTLYVPVHPAHFEAAQ